MTDATTLMLPSKANAKLPAVYETAKAALARCARIDECQDWADKTAALASYGRQAEDDALYNMAIRIQARAIRRAGELLQAIEPNPGGRPAETQAGDHPSLSRTAAAKEAGITPHQQKTALRVASVPETDFERVVESANPPTVTKLAEMGTQHKLLDLRGRDPKEFALSTQAQGQLRRFAEFTREVSPAVAVQGAFDNERPAMMANSRVIVAWIEQMLSVIEEASNDNGQNTRPDNRRSA